MMKSWSSSALLKLVFVVNTVYFWKQIKALKLKYKHGGIKIILCNLSSRLSETKS